MSLWKGMAKAKKKAKELLEEAKEGLGEARKGLEETTERAQEELRRRGGIGQATEDAVLSAGEAVGRSVGHVAKTADGYSHRKKGSLSTYHKEGEYDVDAAGAKGREVADKTIGTTKTVAKRAAGEAVNIAHKVGEAAEGLAEKAEKMADYDITEDDRAVTVGRVTYRVDNVETKTEIQAVETYLKKLSKQMPGAVKGRKTLLDYAARNGFKSEAELKESWAADENPPIFGYKYLFPEEFTLRQEQKD